MSHPATNYSTTEATDALKDVLEVTEVKKKEAPMGVAEDTHASDSTT